MKNGVFILFLFVAVSCQKDKVMHPYSVVSVKFVEEENFVFIEKVESSWSKDTKLAQLSAYGYKFERFNLYLPKLQDTGYYPNPTIQNISYTDGLDFIPFKTTGGFIRINFIDSLTVGGDFKVSLEDNFNGAENKTIIGSFTINIH